MTPEVELSNKINAIEDIRNTIYQNRQCIKDDENEFPGDVSMILKRLKQAEKEIKLYVERLRNPTVIIPDEPIIDDQYVMVGSGKILRSDMTWEKY